MKRWVLVLGLSLNLLQAEVTVVATPTCAVETLSEYQVKNLFMLKKTSLDGEAMRILDRKEKQLYEDFVEMHIHKSLRQMKAYWVRMLFTGKKIAPQKLSFDELLTLEYGNDCYLSYINAQEHIELIDWKAIVITEME